MWGLLIFKQFPHHRIVYIQITKEENMDESISFASCSQWKVVEEAVQGYACSHNIFNSINLDRPCSNMRNWTPKIPVVMQLCLLWQETCQPARRYNTALNALISVYVWVHERVYVSVKRDEDEGMHFKERDRVRN